MCTGSKRERPTVNGRGNGALAKIGAVKEAVLRRSFLRSGRHYDQALWSIVREDWRRAKAVWGAGGSLMALRFSTHRLRSGGSTKSSECDHFRGSEGIQRTGSNVFSTA